jgi:hypothetical protein
MCVDSFAVEEAVLGIAVYPCSTKQQGNHYQWFDECSCAHSGSVYRYTIGRQV